MNQFDQWNKKKKIIETPKKTLYFKERDIFSMKMGRNIGHEEHGKGEEFLRPVLVLKKFDKHIFWGIPLSTTNKRGTWYFEFTFIKKVKSVALLPQ